MPSLIITLVGPDRPGLIGAVSDVVKEHGGNWLESRMSHLAGQFAGIVLVDVSDARSRDLIESLSRLSEKGLKVLTELDSSSPQSSSEDSLWQINVVGNDRPGIVREFTQALAAHDVNVEELTTHCSDAPQGGGQIFRAEASIRIPQGLATELLQSELERLATDLMIDLIPDSVAKSS